MSLTRKELDRAGCDTPGCGHDHTITHFHGRCHPNACVSAAYDKRTGEITIRCARCEQLIAHVAVAGEAGEARSAVQ